MSEKKNAQKHPERPDGVWPPVAQTRSARERVSIGGAYASGYTVEGVASEEALETEVKRYEIQRETEQAANELARSPSVSVGQTNLTPLEPTAEVAVAVAPAAPASTGRRRGQAAASQS